MQDFDDLFDLLNRDDFEARSQEVKATSTCIACGKQADQFRHSLARFQYQMFALCQSCQDRYFGATAKQPGP